MNVKDIFGGFKSWTIKRSPEITTATGILGMAASLFLCVKATKKSIERIEKQKEELQVDEIAPRETLRLCWKYYIPTASAFTLSTISLIGSNRISAKRNASLAAAYALTEAAFEEYKSKVIETIGEKKAIAIDEAIAEDHVKDNPPNERIFVMGGKNDEVLFRDDKTGNVFYCTVNQLDKIENNLNSRLIHEMWIPLTDFYYEVGMVTKIMDQDGYVLDKVPKENGGWDIDKGLINFHKTPIAIGDKVCWNITYDYSEVRKDH